MKPRPSFYAHWVSEKTSPRQFVNRGNPFLVTLVKSIATDK